ncbi:MAG TPA: hypothetical protein V6C58_00135, partial [Allocoleopsis sp.]
SNGGLTNFVRLQEYWSIATTNTNTRQTLKIQGSLIEARQSYYDTAPYAPIAPTELDTSGTDAMSLFGYTVSGRTATGLDNVYYPNSPTYYINTNGFRPRGGGDFSLVPYFTSPKRLWGYDVGILNASPDLFSQRFTTPPTGSPNQSFRPVGRDDPWVQSLLCATQMPNDANNRPSVTGNIKTGYDDSRSSSDILAAYGNNYTFAVSQDQRPSKCPVCWGSSCP